VTHSVQPTRRDVALGLISAGMALRASAEQPWKVLLVVAHPDDEYYFAATVYRLAQELNAVVDQVVITNGEGGYRYSALAEKYYGVALTDEAIGRARLPEIRKRETLAAGRILGIRNHYFLGQQDLRYTQDPGEAPARLWDMGFVRKALRELLTRERYDFVFTLLPRDSTHGHHQSATTAVAEIARELPEAQRPAILAAEPGRALEPATFTARPDSSLSRAVQPEPEFEFDRTRSFGYEKSLRYDIVVNWVISEHKSQGMFQNDWGKHDVERFWLLAGGPTDARERTARLSADLNRQH
jgi:LmbE family N-acetylglucosaminyl deacetylase